MPTVEHQASPPANVVLNLGADISFGAAEGGFTSSVMHATFLEFGTVSKGVTDSVFYVMYQIDDPEGTVFDSIQFKLNFELISGLSGSHPFWFGCLVKDGVWENQPDSFPVGVGNYLLKSEFQKGSALVDSDWVSGTASVDGEFHSLAGFVAGDPVTIGSVGTGSYIEDDKFLTDFQTAFDENESSRSVLGVPIFLHMYPQLVDVQRMWQFSSQNHADINLRPTLTLVTPEADIGNIFDAIAKAQQADVVSMVQQLDVVVKSQQADVAVKAQRADVVARAQQANVVAAPQQADVTAKPQEIDVVAGAEDGND